MKTCTKCKIEKELIEFGKCKIVKSGIRSICKKCNAEQRKIYVALNREKIYIKTKEYNIINKEIKKEKRKIYNLNNKEKIALYKKIYNEINKEKIVKQRKIYRKVNKDTLYVYSKEYHVNRKKTDPLFKFSGKVRSSISSAFKRSNGKFRKNSLTEKILGCTILEFTHYIESKLKEGMTLSNHGKWHLDHIIPVSRAKTEEEIIKLNHYTNFQPLWAEENLKKGNKIIN